MKNSSDSAMIVSTLCIIAAHTDKNQTGVCIWTILAIVWATTSVIRLFDKP